jgi:hypothetical protein
MCRGIPVGNMAGDAIALLSRKDVRVSVLGHIQRGGSPTPYDRVLATRFGLAVVDLIAAGGFGKTVGLKGEHIKAVDTADAIGQMKAVEPHSELTESARAIGICFGDQCPNSQTIARGAQAVALASFPRRRQKAPNNAAAIALKYILSELSY